MPQNFSRTLTDRRRQGQAAGRGPSPPPALPSLSPALGSAAPGAGPAAPAPPAVLPAAPRPPLGGAHRLRRELGLGPAAKPPAAKLEKEAACARTFARD